LSEVDVILLSNYRNMLALPYITECTGFKGVIYATEPTLHIGRYVTLSAVVCSCSLYVLDLLVLLLLLLFHFCLSRLFSMDLL